MRFPRFDMERMQSTWEHKIRYDLSESGVEALTLEEITRDPKELMRTGLGYAEGVGREATRALVASFHAGRAADDVVITTGTSEANFLALATLVSTGDEVVVVMPNYMQVHGIATGMRARVREVWLREEHGWTIDLDALRVAVNARTIRRARSSRRARSPRSFGSPTVTVRGSSRTRSIAARSDRAKRARRSADAASGSS